MNCKEGTALILRQMGTLLKRIPLAEYQQPIPLFNGASIGQHVRHILDFYQCLLRDCSTRPIDYARRDRDPRLETDPECALAKLDEVVQALSFLQETEKVKVVAEFSSEASSGRPVVTSSVARELMYAYDHAIHHLAIIKMGLKTEFPHIEVSNNLGVAPSTLKWQQQQVAGKPKSAC
jgi:uncharacterized damage-inducible protein DinB